ncbi:hypothetical protein PILCRDRAFT_7585 [Piloderma croceum F 1598]|uniref:Tetratricopeptide repeat protein n=1 Tax=Piloderma croceum (strain F 1598) TaxID=765440 RepID=A0A0C3B8Q9_PILCF|nr:hypothetical protein PILCRDRAFT_7585 [Piloderma croceum F 1598]
MEKSPEPQLYLEQIENLNACHPDWPFALVRLGKAYLLLEDLHGALETFEKASSLLSPVKDEIFAQYVNGLRAFITDLEAEEDAEWAEPSDGVIISPWAPLKDIGQYKFSDARYIRLLCIETNEIENVFALSGESLPRLVNTGFYAGAIDGVKAEGIQEPQKIISILGDLQEKHKIAMKSSRIGSYYDGENTIFYLTHPGVYRKRLITTSLTPEDVVQYTHQSKVPSEMNLFMGMMRKCFEEKHISPFVVAPWTHAAFARWRFECHYWPGLLRREGCLIKAMSAKFGAWSSLLTDAS